MYTCSNPLIAFKALVSGDVGTNAWKINTESSKGIKASAVTTGQYTFWQEPNALAVGVQEPFAAAGSFNSLQDCLDACDIDKR